MLTQNAGLINSQNHFRLLSFIIHLKNFSQFLLANHFYKTVPALGKTDSQNISYVCGAKTIKRRNNAVMASTATPQ